MVKHYIFQLSRLIGKVILLFLTFAIGVGGTWLIRIEIFPETVVESSPPLITLCQLTQNPKIYDGKVIRVEAVIDEFDGKFFISDKTCNLSTPIVGIGFEQENEIVSAKLRTQLSQENINDLLTPVVVTGTYIASAKFNCFVGWDFGGIRATSVDFLPISK